MVEIEISEEKAAWIEEIAGVVKTYAAYQMRFFDWSPVSKTNSLKPTQDRTDAVTICIEDDSVGWTGYLKHGSSENRWETPRVRIEDLVADAVIDLREEVEDETD